jgi:tRNA modification GTPase
MKFLYSDDPIIACSTSSHANAAMAVIRISGFQLLDQFQSFFKKDLRTASQGGPIEPRKVYYLSLYHPVLQGQVLDDICLTYFEGPRSYNGENVLELSVHGNTLNIERIMELFVAHGGCRLAAPGEFTYRALKNKKLTLSQIEGLDLFLNANSGFALDQGLSLLSGNLHEIYQELYDLFLVHKSSLELSIDFSEDIGEEAAKDYFHQSLENFSLKFQTLVKRVRPLEHNLLSPEIVLAGLPNSGKSSLFNYLLSENRAIVSSVAGTTRDYLTETIVIEGVKYKLIDTAGIRESEDLIEAEGIRRTKKKLEQSFFSILLINPLEMVDGFEELAKNRFDLSFFTHSDLPGFTEAKAKILERHPEFGPTGAIDLSNSGPNLEVQIIQQINKKYLSEVSGKPILLNRHKQLILQANQILLQYQEVARHETDVAIISQELNTLGHCISELLGIVSPDQILNSIFSNFCIGK